MPDCGVHYLWFAFVCFLIRSPPPPQVGPLVGATLRAQVLHGLITVWGYLGELPIMQCLICIFQYIPHKSISSCIHSLLFISP